MKLVFVTQVLDADDAVLGFVMRWVQGLAAHCDRVRVLALEVGNLAGLPANVEVQVLGRRGRLVRWLRYRRFLRKAFAVDGFDTLLAHMVPRYASLADGVVRAHGGRTFLWYTHKGVDKRLLQAIAVVDRVFTASQESLRVDTPKRLVTGHGIDLGHFEGPQIPSEVPGPRLLSIGRLTPAKDPMTTLDALAELRRRGITATLEWVGGGLVGSDEAYQRRVRERVLELGLESAVQWSGMVPYRQIAERYRSADLLVSSSLTGSVDKVVLEAMASRLPVIASGEAYPPLWTRLGEEAQALAFEAGNGAELAERVAAMWARPAVERAALGERLREIVAQDHEVDGLMERLVVAMGTGGSAVIDTAFREPIERVLGWMQALRTPQGVMLCPEHRIEHTGKNAGLVVMACELVRLGVGDHEELYTLALEQALRIAGRLDREGNSTCWTFRPGRHDPYNCSNNVIDGGACSDALGTFLETFDERLSPGVRNILERACVLHAQTYLRYAAFDKGIAAQRAWALTGVAQAWKRSGHGVLEYATLEGVKALFEAMHPDGSYAYHAPDGGPAHPGAADVSAFYQSRIAAFSMFSLEAVGQDLRDPRWREPLQKQLAFLAALYGPDGIKVGSIEAKPWYHGAHYEVASHPFDVYALARGARLFEDASLGRVALAAWRAWVAHLTPEGRPQDHLPGPGRQRSYQCPTFWAGHTMWMARALEDLHWLEFEDGPAKASAPEVPRVEGFAQAGLVRLENAHWVAWVRGAHPPSNWMHGSPVGAGLLRIFDKERGRDHLVCDSEATRADGHWVGTHGRWPRLRAAWRKNRHELRFSWWLARNAFRRAGLLAALREPLRAVRVGIWGFASNQTRSAWCVDPALERMPDGVRLEGRMVWHDGTRAGSAVLVRTYRIDAEHLFIEEVCRTEVPEDLRFEAPTEHARIVCRIDASPAKA